MSGGIAAAQHKRRRSPPGQQEFIDLLDTSDSDGDSVAEVPPPLPAAQAVQAIPPVHVPVRLAPADAPAWSVTALDAAHPEWGWVARGRAPAHLLLARPDALDTALRLRPNERGRVMMMGRVIETPRYQVSYGRDYHFTGLAHPAQPGPLPASFQDLLAWANSVSSWWPSHPTLDAMGRRINFVPSAPTVSQLQTYTDAVAADRDPQQPPAQAAVVGDVGQNVAGPNGEPLMPPGPLAAAVFNQVLANWYMDGSQYIGPHSDDTHPLVPLSPIFCLSLGHTRTFRMRPVAPCTGQRQDFTVRGGDFLVMGGATQRFWKHEIVKVAGAKAQHIGPRVSITLRMFR